MNFDPNETSFHFDRIEWLTLDDTERLSQLNIDPDSDMPSGFYIHNPNTYPMYCAVNEQTKYSILDWEKEGGAVHKSVNKKEFSKYLEQYSNLVPPFRLITKDGYVQSITEQYVP